MTSPNRSGLAITLSAPDRTMQFAFGSTVAMLLVADALFLRSIALSSEGGIGIILVAGISFGMLMIAAAGWTIHRDNFGRQLADMALQDSERKHQMLVEGVKDCAMLMLGSEGEITSWSPGAERITGFAFEEIAGASFSRFFTANDVKRGRLADILRIAAAGGEYDEEQGMRIRKDGTRYLMRATYSAWSDPGGNLRGFSVIARDLTESTDSGLKYRGLMEAAPDAMVVVNQSGEIVLLNVQAEKQFGYRRDELLGQKVTNIIPEGFAERLIADDLRSSEDALAQQIGTGIELNALRKDGSEFPIEIMLSPLESAEGVLITAAIRDISVRRAAEKHLGQMESRYRGLLEAAPDAMVVVNQAGEIVLLNVQAEKQFGYRRDELLGQKVTNIIPAGFAERLVADALRSDEDALAQQIGTGIELTGRRKDGDEFPIEIMLSPLESTEGEGTLVTAAIRNISVRKHMERLKDEFVATVSHELRTPLTSISGSLGLLVGLWAGKLPEPAARLMTVAHTNSQRLVRLVNDILDIEKFEFGRVVFQLSRVDVRAIVEQAIEANRGFAEGYDVRVRLDAASSGGKVNADPDRLAQVITNLLSNAIKFSPAGGEVVVKVENRGNAVRISVRDQGAGIPADFKPHIFKKFAQADATDTRQKGGTGLGLSIAKQIIGRLGGDLGFDDAPGGGTIFYVELPGWDSTSDWETDIDAQAGAARILLCEDDRDSAMALRERLRQSGFAVDFAYTAGAAVERAAVTEHAAFLVDLHLPDDDGISLIVRLRNLSQHRETPIIVISGTPDEGRDDVRSDDLNVVGWLCKPVDLAHLLGIVRTSIPMNRRPRVLHVDSDPETLAIVTDVLRRTADVVSADSLFGARIALAAVPIDLAVLDTSVGAESGLDLLPSLRTDRGDAIPVIVFSDNVAGLTCDEQIQAALVKSDTSLESLVATVRDHLPLVPDDIVAEEVA